MFLGIMLGLVLMGIMCMLIDVMLPIRWIPYILITIKSMGAMLVFLGIGVYISRAKTVGAHLLIAMPNSKRPININQHISGNARLEPGKLLDLEHIASKNKIYRDTGGNIRIAGHVVNLTHENSCHTNPVWVIDFISQIKDTWGVDKIGKLKDLYEKLKTAKDHSEVLKIPELKALLEDDAKRQKILSMDIKDINNMAEEIFNGRTVNLMDYYDFEESAAPYDMDSFVTQHFAHRQWQFNTYTKLGGMDWQKIVIPFTILLVVGAIAYQIFGS